MLKFLGGCFAGALVTGIVLNRKGKKKKGGSKQRLDGKVAIVTGAGSQGPGMGIGKAISIAMAREGARVMLVGRTEEPLQETAKIFKAEGLEYDICPGCDVGNANHVSEMVKKCVAKFGKVNVLVNNVGIVCPGTVEQLELKEWDRVMNCNVFGAFYAIRECIPHMLNSGELCSIINIGSISGIRALRAETAYCSSKGAMHSITKSVGMEFIANGIRCNGVLPGLIHTPLVDSMVKGADADKALEIRRQMSPTKDMGEGFDIAHAVVYMASDESKYTNGCDLIVDGGLVNQCQLNTLVAGIPAAMPLRLDRSQSLMLDSNLIGQTRSLEGKVVIVTGAGSEEALDADRLWGIGKTIAVVLARHGAKVWAVDVDEETLASTKEVIDKEAHGKCHVHRCDVSSPEDVQNMVRACVAEFGQLDGLVNNVEDTGNPSGVLDTSPERFQEVFKTNATSIFLTCKYAVPELLKSQGPSIVNISSISSLRYLRPEIAYTVSKACVNSLTMQVGMQYAAQGLRCNAVLPGLIDTARARQMVQGQSDPQHELFERRITCPEGRGGDAFDVAYLVEYLLCPESRYTNGQLIAVDAGITSRVLI